MISDYYFAGPLHNTAGIVFAFLSLLILIYVFNGKDLSMITSLAVRGTGNSAKTSEKDLDVVAGTSDAQAAKAVTLSLSARSKLGLSEREIEVMEMFAQGRSASWIADRLMVSTSTVRSHIRAVYVKTGVHSRQDLLDFLAAEKNQEVAKLLVKD
jgi:DNA-binding CsgD family transcriptional regulator